MFNKHAEMTHVLGLKDNPFGWVSNSGWFMYTAWRSVKDRYKRFTNNPNANLNVHLLGYQPNSLASEKITSLENGGYVGLMTSWSNFKPLNILYGEHPIEGHAYTIHAVKEGDNTHFIYVNRGEKHYTYDDQGNKVQTNPDETVMVFTIPNTQAKEFAKEMIGAAKSINSRSNMSKFLHKHKNQKNESLSQLISKSNQKTGNCTVANSNITWHFQLASNIMKKSIENKDQPPKTFEQAYNETKSLYKAMRVKDRVDAFIYLIKNRNYYLSNKAYSYNYIQSILKFCVKDKNSKDGDLKHIELLVDKIKGDPKLLKALLEPLLSTKKYQEKINEFLDGMIRKFGPNIPKEAIEQYRKEAIATLNETRNTLLKHAFQHLDQESQEKYIKQDVSLFRYGSTDVQRNLMLRAPDTYRPLLVENVEASLTEAAPSTSYEPSNGNNASLN